MPKPEYAALFAACLAATCAPTALAGDFFVNGQFGEIDLESDGFDGDGTSLVQGSAGYRWGIGMAQVGVEAGLGKLGEREDGSRHDYAGGHVDHRYTLDSRFVFAGLNARIKPPLLPVYAIGRAGYVGFRHELGATSIDQYLDTPPLTDRRVFSRNDGGSYVGLGVGTTLLPLLDVGLMVNQYRYAQVRYDAVNDEYELSDDKRTARSVSLTVEYRF